MAFALGFSGTQIGEFQQIAMALYQLYLERDASLLEVNPLIVTKAGKLVAHIGGETIGRDAYVGWSLALADPSIFKKALAAAGNFSAAIFQEMSFNEANSARAFATSLNQCVQEAVDKLMDEAGLDKSRVQRETEGLLGRLI